MLVCSISIFIACSHLGSLGHDGFGSNSCLWLPYQGVESIFTHGVLQGCLHVSSLVFIILLVFFFFLVVLGTIHNLTKIAFLDWSVIRAHMSIWEAVRVEG